MNFLTIVFIIILFVLLYILTIGSFLYTHCNMHVSFYHDVLHWHEPGNNQEYYNGGDNISSTCKHCGKRIMQDGQGNWF